jgi:gliding motility-associated-like protein
MGENYEWDFGNGMTSTDENPRIYYSTDTNSYPVRLVTFNQWGCADTVWRWVKVIPEFNVYVPNAFTPDGDGLNEFFTISGTAIVEADLEIFDRWGASLYWGENLAPLTKGWDGNFNGGPVPQGTYAYRLVIRDVFNLVHEYHGHINLIR